MHDYIISQLAADRAETLRAEATAHRLTRRASTRRTGRLARLLPHPTRRSLRAA